MTDMGEVDWHVLCPSPPTGVGLGLDVGGSGHVEAEMPALVAGALFFLEKWKV